MGLLGGGATSKSGNHAWDEIKSTYYPQAKMGVQGFNAFGNALGIGGDFGAQQGAYDNFLNNSGYKYVLDQGMKGVTDSAAGKFMLRSGSTAKALQDRSVNIGKTFYENYLDRLAQMSGMGMGAGNLMVNAGQYSKQSGGGGGIGSLIGGALSAGASAGLFSDERLKENVVRAGEFDDGLPVVEYDYRRDTGLDLPEGRFRGVMAQDVARLRPWALGPEINGYMTVNYGAL